jgi:hypothetical protein
MSWQDFVDWMRREMASAIVIRSLILGRVERE